MQPAEAGPFERAWRLADRIPGWLTEPQARLLWSHAAALPLGAQVVEIGSHQGRSTVVLGSALAQIGGRLTAVDPFDARWRYGGPDTERLLRSHLREAGVDAVVEVHRMRSEELRPEWQRPLDLVYVDGKHDYWSVRRDLDWSQHLAAGGRLLVHDAFSSLGVTLALLAQLAFSRELAYLSRTGSLAVLERRRPRSSDRLRLLRELPWFVRNLVVKVLLRLRLGRVAAVLGHRGEPDPY